MPTNLRLRKPKYTSKFAVVCSPELRDIMEKLADEQHRSLGWYIRHCLELYHADELEKLESV